MTMPKLLVGIGASAECRVVERLLASLPEGSGMAFLIVQQDQDEAQRLIAALQGRARIQIGPAVDGETLEADKAYLVPPAVLASVKDRRISLASPSASFSSPLDHLFRSL